MYEYPSIIMTVRKWYTVFYRKLAEDVKIREEKDYGDKA